MQNKVFPVIVVMVGTAILLGFFLDSRATIIHTFNIVKSIIFLIGVIPVVLIFLFLFFLQHYKRNEIDFLENDEEMVMPLLTPVSIPTKNQDSVYKKWLIYFYSVRKWKLMENWKYELVADDGKSNTIIIPKGFVFDGASIPRIFWFFLSPIGLLLIPALIHDYGYKYNQLWTIENGKPVAYMKEAGQKYWDNLFKYVGNNVNNIIVVNTIARFAVGIAGKKTFDGYRDNGIEPEIPVLD